jgi:hypothetical protein
MRTQHTHVHAVTPCAPITTSRTQVDEYFVQDTWQGPPGLADRVLLALGDPLEMVDVPFVPSTLVQDWVVEE